MIVSNDIPQSLYHLLTPRPSLAYDRKEMVRYREEIDRLSRDVDDAKARAVEWETKANKLEKEVRAARVCVCVCVFVCGHVVLCGD